MGRWGVHRPSEVSPNSKDLTQVHKDEKNQSADARKILEKFKILMEEGDWVSCQRKVAGRVSMTYNFYVDTKFGIITTNLLTA